MITIRIKGGIGNQLFQYAAGYSLAKRLGQDLDLDTSFFLNQTLREYRLDKMNIENGSIANDKDYSWIVSVSRNRYVNRLLRMLKKSDLNAGAGWKILIEAEPAIKDTFFSISGQKIFVDGYYQSVKYFEKNRQDLLRQFTPNYLEEAQFKEMLHRIKTCNSVAVHVRRGDFIKAQHYNAKHYLLDEEYYIEAIKYIEKKIEAPQFFWFSDDIEWVKSNFGKKENFNYVSLSTTNPDIDEIMLMKESNSIITANSTFSWWGAWLNENDNSIKIVPSKNYGSDGMIPDSWIKI